MKERYWYVSGTVLKPQRTGSPQVGNFSTYGEGMSPMAVVERQKEGDQMYFISYHYELTAEQFLDYRKALGGD